MLRRPHGLVSLPIVTLGLLLLSGSTPMTSPASLQTPSRLAVLWTSGDPEVALNVAFMYTLNAKKQGWFDEVTLIVWGPSAKLLSEHRELRERVAQMLETGVEVLACKACADGYGVSGTLEGMGIEVKYMGEPLTRMLQDGWKVLTF